MFLKRYLLGLTITLNLFANAVLGGEPGMTISARAGFARAHGNRMGTFWCAALDSVFLGRTDHCNDALLGYLERAARNMQKAEDRWPLDAPTNGGFMYWIPAGSKTIFISHPKHTEQLCVEHAGGLTTCMNPASDSVITLIDWGSTYPEWPIAVRILVNGEWRELTTTEAAEG